MVNPSPLEPPEFHRYPELRAHFNAVYDHLTAGQRPHDASPLLDVGAGTGAALFAVVFGTGLRGVAVDLRRAAEWIGPPEFDFLMADAQALPFPDRAFPATLSMETLEWFADPGAALREMARVTRDRLVIVHTDWHSLWFDSGDPDTAREFTRLFAGPIAEAGGHRLPEIVTAAGLSLAQHDIHTVRGDVLAPETYARHLLALLREWLVQQDAGVRARRFDTWRADLDTRAEAGEFAFSLNRHVVVVER